MNIDTILLELEALGAKRVKVAVTDIDGVLRGKVISINKFKSILKGSFGFCNVIFGWDCSDESYTNGSFAGWHTGYPDEKAFIDPSTLRTIPWDSNTPFFLADFSKEGGAYVCPRTLLKKVNNELERTLGLTAKFSQEFEWFNFEETPESFENKHFVSPKPMTPGMFGYSLLRSSQKASYFNDIFDSLTEFDIPIEGLHTETGPGVYEAAIEYGEVIKSADRAVLFKTSVKELAYKQGIMASFMAKWNENLPGCSGHVHQSLWDGGINVFQDLADPDGMSELFKSYIAGQLHCLPHLIPLLAPNINSFKRLVVGAWAPTTFTWGIDNRTVALRALPGGEKSSRLECRIPGSDTNPYLVMAACLASGMYGVKNRLKLKQPKTTGNGYNITDYGLLPRGLWEATQFMKFSDLANELLGEDFVKHFAETREWECHQHANAVSDWELKRYFEII
jgi:glutamine synthetase